MEIKREDLIEENLSLNIKNDNDIDKIVTIAEALSNEIRVKILQRLERESLSIPQLSKIFYTSMTSMVYHVNMLHNAALIDVKLMPTKNGNVRVCYRLLKNFNLQFYNEGISKPKNNITKFSCPIGDYIDISDDVVLNSISKDNKFVVSRPNSAFDQERHQIGQLWTSTGKISYAFSNEFSIGNLVEEISFSLEICSEAILYNNHYKSDITFWINNVELLTWECPGDFGDRPGLLSPDFWKNASTRGTQYGILVNIVIKNDGVYFNGDIVNKKVNILTLKLDKYNKLLLTIGNKENAVNNGGFNIFGKDFGDYPIDIEFEAKTSIKL